MYVTSPSQLTHEKGIVWLEEPESFPFVREAMADNGHPRGPFHNGFKGRLIGYAELDEEASPVVDQDELERWPRRVYWLAAQDEAHGFKHVPLGAVDPATIAIGVPGRRLQPTNQVPLVLQHAKDPLCPGEYAWIVDDLRERLLELHDVAEYDLQHRITKHGWKLYSVAFVRMLRDVVQRLPRTPDRDVVADSLAGIEPLILRCAGRSQDEAA